MMNNIISNNNNMNNNNNNNNSQIILNNQSNNINAPYSYLLNSKNCYDSFDINDFEIIQRIPIDKKFYDKYVNNRSLGNCKEFLNLVKQTLQNEHSKYLAFYKIIVKPISLLKMFVKINRLFENYPILLKYYATFFPPDFINWIIQLKQFYSSNEKELYFQRIFLYDHVVPDIIHSETFNYCYYFKLLG